MPDLEAPKSALPLVPKPAAVTETLVKMSKDGKVIHVHPSTVDAHRKAGWA